MSNKNAPTPVVGRGDELAVLGSLLVAARAGSAGRVVIEGEPGIGKTRLVDALVGDAHVATFRGVAEELLHDRPFGVFIDALAVDRASTDPQRRTIAELLDAPGEPTAIRGVDHRHRIAEAIEDALEHEAIQRPLVLVVEDAHWADAGSILALYRIVRRDDLPILTVVTCRPLPRSAELAGLLDALGDAGALAMRLRPLDEEAVAALARSRLGAPPGPALGAQLARAGGNPLFVLELLDGLIQEDVVELSDGVAEARHALEPAPSMRALIIRRLGIMSRASVDVLRTACVIGESFSAAELASALQSDVAAALHALDEPLTTGFVVAEGERFAFRHDLVREVLYADMPPAVRKAMHLHVGRTLATAGASDVEVAHHFAAGADAGDRDAVRRLQDAAYTVAPRAPDIAADFARRAAALLPEDDPSRIGLLLPAVRQLTMAGRTEEALALAGSMRSLVAGTPWQALLDGERINVLIEQGRLTDVDAVIDEVLLDPSADDAYRTLFLGMRAAIQLANGDVAAAERTIADVRPFARQFPTSGAAAVVGWNEGIGAWMHGAFGDAVDAFERALPGTELFSGGRPQGLLMLAMAHCLADSLGHAYDTLETARGALERRGMLTYIAEHHWFLGAAHFIGGRWDDALAEVAASRDVAVRTGATGLANALPDPTPLVHAFRGDVRAAVHAVTDPEREPPVLRTALVRNWRDPGRAIALFASADLPAAVATLRDWRRAVDDAGFVPDLRTVGRTLVRICRQAGDHEMTAALVGWAEGCAARAPGIRSVESAALLVRAAAGETDAAAAALAAARGVGRPFDVAEAAAEAAIAAAERGDRQATGELVREAVESYEGLAAHGALAAFARDLRVRGIKLGARRPRTRATHGWAALTDSERRVVALVREGLTNVEIAERLFISKGTVATHLRSVFRKLSVTSRADLRRRRFETPA